jgi:hypothetical protein
MRKDIWHFSPRLARAEKVESPSTNSSKAMCPSAF